MIRRGWEGRRRDYLQLNDDIDAILDLEFNLANFSVPPSGERDATKLYHIYSTKNSWLYSHMAHLGDLGRILQ